MIHEDAAGPGSHSSKVARCAQHTRPAVSLHVGSAQPERKAKGAVPFTRAEKLLRETFDRGAQTCALKIGTHSQEESKKTAFTDWILLLALEGSTS